MASINCLSSQNLLNPISCGVLGISPKSISDGIEPHAASGISFTFKLGLPIKAGS